VRSVDDAKRYLLTDPANAASSRLLESIGLRFQRRVKLPKIAGESALYAIERAPWAAARGG
jgi:hypothetical protein